LDSAKEPSAVPGTGITGGDATTSTTKTTKGGEEWHPELQILSKQARVHSDEAIDALNGVLVDNTHQPEIIANETEAESAPLLPPDSSSAHMTAREGKRLGRKQRRLAAGKWKPSAQAETNIENVLGKIDAMDGPSIRPKKAKSTVKAKTAGMKPREKAKAGRVDSKTKEAKKTPSYVSDRPKKETWKVQKAALSTKFGETGWQPRKRLSPDTLEGIRALHKSDPAAYSTAMLAEHFKITPEAIRRVLKSKWKPSEDEVEDRRLRWEKRGVKKWEDMSKQGARPPAQWRARGVKSPAARSREEGNGKRGVGREDGYIKWADS